ncbi:hypothetical protein JCM10908_005504 [Rhodotorula pacifica]|uniref:uncharacterized protein n=1 Tax=Rhodotorula pacifica TaxID=1495444 RepID=UPI00316B3B3A
MRSAAASPGGHQSTSTALLANISLLLLLSFGKVNAQLLANGSYFQSGSLSANWLWQASGTLTHSRCPWTIARYMSDCYRMALDSDGNLESTTQADYLASPKKPSSARQRRAIDFTGSNTGSATVEPVALSQSPVERAAALASSTEDYALDAYFEAFPDQASFRYAAQPEAASKNKRQFDPNAPGLDNILASSSARQRNEILSWPGAPSGQTWHYTWKSYQDPTTTSNNHFFHSWQILRRDGSGGPVVTLDYTNGNVELDDIVRGCSNCVPFSGGTAAWFGRVISHDLKITYGVAGSIAYSAAYAPASPTTQPILSYSAKGDMGSSASLKFGNYRLFTADLSPAIAYVGDFTQTRLA